MEERAKPLKGVMVDYGYRLYGTTQQDAFPARTAGGPPSTRAGVKKARGIKAEDMSFAMTQPDVCFAAQKLSVPPPSKTGFLTRREAPVVEDSYGTTYGHTFGVPAPITKPTGPAVGRSGKRPERGMATSGMIGEVYKTSDEPAKDTACQRSWLPTGTLVIDPETRPFNRGPQEPL